MQLPVLHSVHRHPATPWAELRVSARSSDCYRLHTHAQYSVGIVDDGEAIFHHPSGPEKLRRGSVVLIEPDVIHACNPSTQQVWSYRMLFVDAQWLHGQMALRQRLVDLVTAGHFASRTIHDPATSELVDRLCKPSASDADATQQTELLSQWLANCMQPGPPCDQPQYPAYLEPALRRMHSGLNMGVAPAEYLQNLRVNGARRLIARGASLAEAAHAVGFADQAHMQRAFKVRHAMTPGCYAPPRNVAPGH